MIFFVAKMAADLGAVLLPHLLQLIFAEAYERFCNPLLGAGAAILGACLIKQLKVEFAEHAPANILGSHA